MLLSLPTSPILKIQKFHPENQNNQLLLLQFLKTSEAQK